MKAKTAAAKPKLVKRGKWYEVEMPKFASREEEAKWLASIDWAPIIPKLKPVRLVPGKRPPCDICGTPMRGRVRPVQLFNGRLTLNFVRHYYCPHCKTEKLSGEGQKEIETVVKALKGKLNERQKQRKR